MLSINFRKCILLPLLALVFSCSTDKETCTVISINENDEIQDIYWENLPYVDLKDSNAVIGVIDKVIYTEKSFLVVAQGKMHLFDTTGTFMRQIGHIGRARNEYSSYSDCWIENNKIHLYDLNGKKIISYSMDGNIDKIQSLKPADGDIPFNFVVPFGKSYVGKCIWNGTKGQSPALALYDPEFQYIKPLGNLTVSSGLRLGYPLINAEKGSLLYWNPLDRKIFRISKDLSVEKEFEISFGSRNFPSTEDVDEYDIISLIQDQKWRAKHSGPITYVWEKNNSLLFLYYHGKELRLAKYNERNSHISSYRFVDSPESALYSCAFHNDTLFFFIETDDNARILKFNLRD